MESFKLKRFSNVAVLKRIDPELLIQFLDHFKTFFVDRCDMNWPDDPGKFDCAALAKILMSPSVNTPNALLEALHLVDELADEDCYDRILEEARNANIDLGDKDPTPEDLTLRVWLAKSSILERIHVEQHRVQPKTFQSFFATAAKRSNLTFMGAPDDQTLAALETELDLWFKFKKKGRGAKVFSFPKEDGLWFLVRHGQRIKREGTVEASGDSGSVFYRPEKFDVLIYYPQTGELAIYAGTKGECKVYCAQFGKHLFGDLNFFEFSNVVEKYTLGPLIDDARSSLACLDVPGITNINLCELHIQHHSSQKDIEIRRADDVFQSLEYEQRELQNEQDSIRLFKAKFRVTFVGGRECGITIASPNIASFDRETDNSVIHDWLTKRGFISIKPKEANAPNGAILEVA